MGVTERLYDRLLTPIPDAEHRLPPGVRENIPTNGVRIVGASALQSSGDHGINASTVLPWLLVTVGAPTALIGLLVPIRESGSMLPQAFLTPWILRVRRRKNVVVTGALIQSAAVGVISLTAAVGTGLAAGLVVVCALAVFAFGRSLTSVASKDVLGRTIPKGQRGQINGLATTAAGSVAITLGLAIRTFISQDVQAWQLAALTGGSAVLWLLVTVCWASVREPADEVRAEPPAQAQEQWLRQMTTTLLRDDHPFRRFVAVRSLLLVSALSPPFVVALSIDSGAGSLIGLGGYIMASGLAALLGGRIFGRIADRSSKWLMTAGAGVASAIIVVTVIVVESASGAPAGRWTEVFFVTVYFALTLTHTGVRVGRKTYVVDMAEGDTRTLYVAVSNSILGLVLLVVGAVSSALATLDLQWALTFLAALGLLGVVTAARLPDVSQHRAP